MFPGIDIIEIERFERACKRHPKIVSRLFTEKEIKCVNGNLVSLAARFAGKEAVLKSLGTGLRGLNWHDIEILKNEVGEPIVSLSVRAEMIAKVRECTSIKVSLSHSKSNATAIALLY
ncbi:MAG: holo-ACP synthase [Eubacteriales bacterium]